MCLSPCGGTHTLEDYLAKSEVLNVLLESSNLHAQIGMSSIASHVCLPQPGHILHVFFSQEITRGYLLWDGGAFTKGAFVKSFGV